VPFKQWIVGGLLVAACVGQAIAQEPSADKSATPSFFAQPPEASTTAEPLLVEKNVALVDQANTAWDAKARLFRPAFRFADEDDPRKTEEAVKGHAAAGELIRQWQKEGTACGLFGVLYDNRDRDHSPLPLGEFPQLTGVEYSEAARRAGLDMGLALRVLFAQPTFGNSSTAMTQGPFWRSQTRIAQVDARSVERLYEQYAANHLYVYPEHRDYDPGHNGQGDGYGDAYPANTPYVITSQGSSYTDQPFLHAIACTLAAFQPATRDKLVETKLLMPAVQMIFRRSNKQVASDADYLTGKAHPPAFQGDRIDVERMVRLAHEIKPDEIPPMIQLAVVKEDEFVRGIDYFEPVPTEKLFDTPAAIARVWRATARQRRIVLTAASSYDAGGRPLKFHWAVLQGRPELIEIKPLKEDASLVEITLTWHERFPVAQDAKMETNRIDIGAFVHNGEYYSAPGFITFYCLDDETRKYNAAGQPESIEYKSLALGGNYADPAVHTLRDWRDEYHYDDAGRLTGWTRFRDGERQHFTAHGHLIVKKDSLGRAEHVRKIIYVVKDFQPAKAPEMEQIAEETIYGYAYESAADRVGKLIVIP
jgi:YD repeat-containing protein